MIDYKIDRSLGIIFTTVFGSTSAKEVVAHIQYLLNDPLFRPNYHVIAELNKDTTIDPRLTEETGAVQKIFMDYAEKRKGSKCAIIVESQTNREIVEYGFNLIDYISADFQIFGNKDDALEWIGVCMQEKKITEKLG